MTLLGIIIENVFLILILTGVLLMLSVFIKDMCDNDEIKNNKNKINNIADISIKTNLGVASLAILIIIFYLL